MLRHLAKPKIQSNLDWRFMIDDFRWRTDRTFVIKRITGKFH